MTMAMQSRPFAYGSRQRGMTLVVGLIMLLVITLFVVSAIRLSTVSLRTVGNMQARSEAAAAGQRRIEDLMSSTTAFTSPSASTVIVPVNGVNYTVTTPVPACVKTVPVTGNSYDNSGLALQDTYWDVQNTAANAASGAAVTTHQGVKVRLSAGANCP